MRLQNFQDCRLIDIKVAMNVFKITDGSLVSIEQIWHVQLHEHIVTEVRVYYLLIELFSQALI